MARYRPPPRHIYLTVTSARDGVDLPAPVRVGADVTETGTGRGWGGKGEVEQKGCKKEVTGGEGGVEQKKGCKVVKEGVSAGGE